MASPPALKAIRSLAGPGKLSSFVNVNGGQTPALLTLSLTNVLGELRKRRRLKHEIPSVDHCVIPVVFPITAATASRGKVTVTETSNIGRSRR
jgi:hypothetical protein